MSLLGGHDIVPSAPCLMRCPGCGTATVIPAGHGIRQRQDEPVCHKVVNLKTGKVHSVGPPK